ncbi:MAG: carbamoyltransferase HypF, partial [Acidimicrobiales bacterium]
MTSLLSEATVSRHRIRVVGVVQGVGFRPYVYRLANEAGLVGHVCNDDQGVLIEVEGPPAALACFESRLVDEAPALSRINGVETCARPPLGETTFRVLESGAGGGGRTFISPDVATCEACRRELFDPDDRRYRYPFTNCTDCGPRFTITERLPYDRANTTMRGFTLCAKCEEEYHDPSDRRFHAQPVACARCGPRLWFEDRQGRVEGTDAALAHAQEALAEGLIVGIKGLGGYHLACDATTPGPLEALRHRKGRPHKAFAVMVADVAHAEGLGEIGEAERALLSSRERPIVLLRRRRDAPLARGVAPDNPYVGVMLPYTPLHHLLFATTPGSSVPAPGALVMTSGNLSDEPICYDDAEARARLGRIVDGWLAHDRPIHVPCDDSVVCAESGRELPIRRSRGYAPLPVSLAFEVPPLLATGGELKNTFCLAQGTNAWMSQHIGDMGSVETMAAFARSVEQFREVYGIEPELVAADAHPGYRIRRWAEEHGAVVELVQHHHGHVAAVMAEHRVAPEGRVIGVAFDGTGYG